MHFFFKKIVFGGPVNSKSLQYWAVFITFWFLETLAMKLFLMIMSDK